MELHFFLTKAILIGITIALGIGVPLDLNQFGFWLL